MNIAARDDQFNDCRSVGDINLELALGYAEAGIPVFPCGAHGPQFKKPLVEHGFLAATTDAEQICRLLQRFHDALIAIPTGPPSGLWIFDIDGEAGRRSLNELMSRLGVQTIADLTRCVSRTPSGGLHLIFRLQPGERPRNRARDIGAGLDTRGVKADGSSAGYFIAPGSILPDGRSYRLIDAADLDLGGAE